MSIRGMNIKSILEISLWEELQDTLAELSGAAIMCVDLKGNPVSKYSGCSNFCSAVRKLSQMNERCQRCAALSGLEAARLDSPYICKCHCGLAEASVPVMVDETYIGSVLIGQFRIAGEDENQVMHLVNEVSSVFQGSSEDTGLRELFSQLPEIGLTQFARLVNGIDAVVKYTVKRFLMAENAREGEAEAMDTHTPDFVDSIIPKSSPLYPAVLYVHEHLREVITMKDMAKLCHLSPSYFSRLFSREAKESFVSYVNRNKVELAKAMLRDSNRSISQISAEIGFHDTSHFISLFKRYEGTTPTVYRQMSNR